MVVVVGVWMEEDVDDEDLIHGCVVVHPPKIPVPLFVVVGGRNKIC